MKRRESLHAGNGDDDDDHRIINHYHAFFFISKLDEVNHDSDYEKWWVLTRLGFASGS